jgi:hypothetical protein
VEVGEGSITAISASSAICFPDTDIGVGCCKRYKCVAMERLERLGCGDAEVCSGRTRMM